MYKICLVEDEINLNNLIKNYLEHEGYEVVTICTITLKHKFVFIL